MEMVNTESLTPSGVTIIDRSAPASTPCIDKQRRDRGPDIMQLARILHRRRRLIATITALGAVLAGTAGLLIAPKYTASAQIVVEPQQAGSTGGRAEASRPIDQSAIDTHVTMLTSRDHLRRVIEGLSVSPDLGMTSNQVPTEMNGTGLADGSPLQPAATNGVAQSTRTTIDTGLSLAELSRRVKIWLSALGRKSTVSRELDELDRGLKVMQERTSRVISVTFTAKSPTRAAAVVNRIVQLYVNGQSQQKRLQASQDLAVLDERAARLKSRLDTASAINQTSLLSQPFAADAGEAEKDGRLRTLERETAAGAQTYAALLHHEKEIRDQLENATPEVRVLSLASPPDRPSSPNPLLFIFPAFIVSLIGASLLAVVLERLDQGLRNEHDVTDALGLPCIGLVPRLPRYYADQPSHYLLSKPFAPYTEAIRSVVAALHLAEPEHKPTTILVSSSVPGEGKSTTAVSLSVCAAQLGKRVLLVDFDSRHSAPLRILYGSSKTPDPDLKDRTPERLVKHIANLNLDYLPMPSGSVDPLASFVGEHLCHFLRQLAHSYDCVFIDSPPLLGVAETRLLASLVDCVVFVIKWGCTRREVVQNAGRILRHVLRPDGGVRTRVSALVTQVDLKRHATYRYGDVGEVLAKYKKYYSSSA